MKNVIKKGDTVRTTNWATGRPYTFEVLDVVVYYGKAHLIEKDSSGREFIHCASACEKIEADIMRSLGEKFDVELAVDNCVSRVSKKKDSMYVELEGVFYAELIRKIGVKNLLRHIMDEKTPEELVEIIETMGG